MKQEIAKAIAELEALGGRLYLAGEKVKFSPADDPQVRSVVEKLRPYREEIRKALQQRTCAPCGSPDCAGCYELWEGGPKLHPPKSSFEWIRWRAKWDKVKQ